MKAAIFAEPKCIDIKNIPVPEPASDEVLIRLQGCGVCGSNFPVWEGREWFKYPFNPGQPGHEGWGIIEQTGAIVSSVKKGDRVAALSYNAYSEYDLAKEGAIVKIPEELNHIPVPGEPLGCAMNIFRRSEINPGDTVAIIGIGFMGSLLIQLAHIAGAKVIAISRRKFSLDIAKQCGADHVIELKDHWKIVDEVKTITDNKLCDKVIEAIGFQWPLDLAGELTKIRGRLIIAGYHQDGTRTVNLQMWNWRGLDVINAHEREQHIYVNGIKDAIEAIKHNKLDPSFLYTNTYALNEINNAFMDMDKRSDGFMKALIINN